MFDNYATPVLKSNRNKKPLMFGDLIAAVFEACGERRARGILTLAINARLVAFLGPQRFVISR